MSDLSAVISKEANHTRKQVWVVSILLVALPLALFANALTIGSPVLGTLASLALLLLASYVFGELLLTHESRVFRVVAGFIAVLGVLALAGDTLVVIANFTEMVTLGVLSLFTIVLACIFVYSRRSLKPAVGIKSEEVDPERKVDGGSILLAVPFLISIGLAFWLLWQGRTGDGGASVWLTIPTFFIPLFLFLSLSLVVVLFFSRLRTSVKLGLACVYSFLAHGLFLLVWYPGRFGDPWLHLGAARYIARTGMPYAYSWMVQQRLVLDLTLNVQEALTVLLARMFSVDIYWIHVLLVPLLWSILVPLIAYKIAAMLAVGKSRIFPVTAAVVTLLFPSLISWGSVSVPNSLGFIFFFASVLFLLFWINKGGRWIWVMSLLISAVAFLAHPQAGLFAFFFVFLGTMIKRTTRKILVFLSYGVLFAGYPLALFAMRGSFVVNGLLSLESFSSFQSDISTFLLVFGVVGLVLSVRNHYVNVRTALMLFAFYVTVLAEYYLTGFGMTGLPYSAGRILTLADFLLVPFVALGFVMLVMMVAHRSGSKSQVGASVSTKRFKLNPSSRRLVGLFLVCLFVSVQATVALYQAYPGQEVVTVQPSAYEVEAIQFIDANSPGRYVVLGHPTFDALAVGFLGLDYGWAGGDRGLFGMPQSQAYQGSWYPTVQMYFDMTKNPSTSILEQAMDFAHASLSYYVLSVREPKFDSALKRALEILPPIRVLGNGELYIFAYPLPFFEEDGATVKVVFDDGAGGEQNVLTRFTYMVESEINSTLTLAGHTSYNVSDFPAYWNFLDLQVNNVSSRFDESSDVNTFVYVRGLQPSDVVTIKWLFNSRYPNVGWKDDSFKRLDQWHAHRLYGGTMTPTITSDGNVLSMSYTFTPNHYWYYYSVTSVNVSTNDYPYLLMRWRSSQPVAVAAVYFDDGTSEEIVSFGSKSVGWSTIVVPLEPDATVSTVMIGLSNVRDQSFTGFGLLEVDSILFAAKT